MLLEKQRNLGFRITLAERTLWLRLAHRLSLRAVATRTGISDSHLSRIERGRAGPTLESLIILCQFYGVTSDYMLGFDRDESQVRKLLDAKGRLTYFRPAPAGDLPRKCTDCDRLLVPGTLHTMGECITFCFHNGRNAAYLAARYGFSVEAIELIVRETLRALPYLAGH